MKKIEERDRRKMDEMKKKLHTDDEGNIVSIEICVFCCNTSHVYSTAPLTLWTFAKCIMHWLIACLSHFSAMVGS